MNHCSKIDDYIDDRLVGEAKEAYRRHLNNCNECNASLDSWQKTKEGAALFVAEIDGQGPTEDQAALLVSRASEPESSQRRVWLPVTAIGAAALAALLLVVLWPNTVPDSGESGIVAIGQEKVGEELESRLVYAVSGESDIVREPTDEKLFSSESEQVIFELGGDRFGLGKSSELKVVRADTICTRVRLMSGTVAVEAKPRAKGAKLLVEANDLTVEVIGTRFMVTNLPDSSVSVDVARGTVRVKRKGVTIKEINAGSAVTFRAPESISQQETQDFDALLVPLLEEEDLEPSDKDGDVLETTQPKVHPSDQQVETQYANDIGLWQDLILAGRYNDADKKIESYLSTNSNDVAAWALLGDCRRKQGKWQDSVSAYRKVIQKADRKVANRARFNAAALLQDKLKNHSQAQLLLSALLNNGAGPRVLEAEAKVRLARCFIALGDLDEARRLLENILKNHQATSAAIQARRLLEEIE